MVNIISALFSLFLFIVFAVEYLSKLHCVSMIHFYDMCW